MDFVEGIIGAADSGWAITALLILGVYAIFWKYGGDVLKLVKGNSKNGDEVMAAVEELKQMLEAHLVSARAEVDDLQARLDAVEEKS